MYVECRYIDYILFNSDGQERSHHVERKTRTMPELLPMFLNAQIYFKGDHIFYKSTLKNVITLNN